MNHLKTAVACKQTNVWFLLSYSCNNRNIFRLKPHAHCSEVKSWQLFIKCVGYEMVNNQDAQRIIVLFNFIRSWTFFIFGTFLSLQSRCCDTFPLELQITQITTWNLIDSLSAWRVLRSWKYNYSLILFFSFATVVSLKIKASADGNFTTRQSFLTFEKWNEHFL